MRRLIGFPSLLIFLVAIATNCVWNSQVALDPFMFSVAEPGTSDTSQTDDGEFLIAGDDDKSRTLLALSDNRPVFNFNPAAACFHSQLTYLPRLPFPHQTILQI